MVFNSVTFIIFFVIVYGLYLVLPHRWQNRWLLLASYVFYGWWDWRFLFLLFLSTAFAYYCGAQIARSTGQPRRKKAFLLLGIIGNLCVLGFFKYFNFFVVNLQQLLGVFGIHGDPAGVTFLDRRNR